MRALLPPPGDGSAVDVHAHYAAGWLEAGGVRVNFVSAVDGAVTAEGLSRGLQTPGDNRVFAALRDLADVVLVGAGTARAEDYGPARFGDRRLAVRRAHGLADAMPIALVSRSLHIDPTARVFGAGRPRPLVLTCETADRQARAALTDVADVIDCGADTVEPRLARDALEARGLRRILCEGGPTLFAQFAEAGAVDELCLSISPVLAGPGPGRITAGEAWPRSVPLSLTGLLEEDGALFCRFRTLAAGDRR